MRTVKRRLRGGLRVLLMRFSCSAWRALKYFKGRVRLGAWRGWHQLHRVKTSLRNSLFTGCDAQCATISNEYRYQLLHLATHSKTFLRFENEVDRGSTPQMGGRCLPARGFTGSQKRLGCNEHVQARRRNSSDSALNCAGARPSEGASLRRLGNGAQGLRALP